MSRCLVGFESIVLFTAIQMKLVKLAKTIMHCCSTELDEGKENLDQLQQDERFVESIKSFVIAFCQQRAKKFYRFSVFAL